jgi:hypothetical protein
MEYADGRSIGDLIQQRERNIVLRGGDRITAAGFTQVPNFLLKFKKLSAGDKLALALILSYMWHNDYCFPGQAKLAEDMDADERTVRRHLKALQQVGLLKIIRRGQGKTNIYEVDIRAKVPKRRS